MKFIIGKKQEMSQRFREGGAVVPVTLVYAPPCRIVRVKTKEKDGYAAVQVGAFAGKKLKKAETGHLKDLPLYRVLKEFRLKQEEEFHPQTELKISQFQAGDRVEVTGLAKGRGFAGVVKRHKFHGHPKTHGHKDQLRMPGSIGTGGVQRVLKGVRMGGHMGDNWVTVKNLEVIDINEEKDLIALRGALPGARNNLVFIKSLN